MGKQYKLRGINDDHNTCEVCGKTNLKKVMWISEVTQDGETLDPFAAGTTCGANLLGVATSRTSRAEAERKVSELAINQIEKAVELFVAEHCWMRGNMYLPKDMGFILVEAQRAGNIQIFIDERNKRYPLLDSSLPVETRIKYA